MISEAEAIVLYEAMVETSQAMLEAARRHDWEDLAEAESCCPDLINELGDFPLASLSGPARERILALISRSLDNHRAVEEVVTAHIGQLSKSVDSVRTERKLSDAYTGG